VQAPINPCSYSASPCKFSLKRTTLTSSLGPWAPRRATDWLPVLPFRILCELLLSMSTLLRPNNLILSVATKQSITRLSPIADRVWTYCIARCSMAACNCCNFPRSHSLSPEVARSDFTQNIVVTRNNGSSESRSPQKRVLKRRYRRRTSTRVMLSFSRI
jgi:hypothetical protein